MAVDLSAVVATFTDYERAVFEARSERLTRRQIANMLGVTPNAVAMAQRNYERKIGKALLPMAYKAIAAGIAAPADIAMPTPRPLRGGVSSINGRWRARISVGGKWRHIGTFCTEEEAVAAREAALSGVVA